ncbi:MAG: Fe2+-dependent dioxygenase [Polyangiaceae bacterium]|nr:Fe2+-dependent dioxygenase [Polyangiaceae bacterium]
MTAPLLILPGAMAPALLTEIRTLLAHAAFGEAVAGRDSTDTIVRIAWPEESEPAKRAAEIVAGALEQSERFRAAAFPAAMMTPRFHRYDVGMRYAEHTDPALLDGSPPLRRDIAMTVALSEPSSYEGGDLVLDLGGATFRWKGEPGDCILYSPDLSHRVDPVARGTRLVAVSWIQSTVRGFERRHVLSEIAGVLKELETGAAPEPHVEALQCAYFNLIRRWI